MIVDDAAFSGRSAVNDVSQLWVITSSVYYELGLVSSQYQNQQQVLVFCLMAPIRR